MDTWQYPKDNLELSFKIKGYNLTYNQISHKNLFLMGMQIG